MATSSVNLSDFDASELPDASEMEFGLVVAEWNAEITNSLAQGAISTLKACGAKGMKIKRFNVPGSMELTYGAKLLCQREKYDAIIVIGTVIQGETKHFDYVCQSVTHGVTELNLQYNTPVIYCVLTDNTIEQSRARSGGEHGNKGVECAVAALKMAGLQKVANAGGGLRFKKREDI